MLERLTARSRAIRLVQRLLFTALRALLLALALHVSGAAHAIVDIAGACTSGVETSADSDCPSDPADCPPGCPNCHGHGIAALPQRAVPMSPLLPMDRGMPAFTKRPAASPTTPELAGPFRPPQIA
jgi:hypothetical protein